MAACQRLSVLEQRAAGWLPNDAFTLPSCGGRPTGRHAFRQRPEGGTKEGGPPGKEIGSKQSNLASDMPEPNSWPIPPLLEPISTSNSSSQKVKRCVGSCSTLAAPHTRVRTRTKFSSGAQVTGQNSCSAAHNSLDSRAKTAPRQATAKGARARETGRAWQTARMKTVSTDNTRGYGVGGWPTPMKWYSTAKTR